MAQLRLLQGASLTQFKMNAGDINAWRYCTRVEIEDLHAFSKQADQLLFEISSSGCRNSSPADSPEHDESNGFSPLTPEDIEAIYSIQPVELTEDQLLFSWSQTTQSSPEINPVDNQHSMLAKLFTSPLEGLGSASSPSSSSLDYMDVAGSSAQKIRNVERTESPVRHGRARRYSRRDRTEKRTGEARDVNDLSPEILKKMKCTECTYVQKGGTSATRSFKRHLATHAAYRKMSWVCRGIAQVDGMYVGGCSKKFSRKDALQRHIKSENGICVSDCVPIVDE